MQQRTLFDDQSTRGMHRKTDPETSRTAAAEVVTTGTASSQRSILLSTVRAMPGQTSDEYGALIDCGPQSRHIAARRLPELASAGLVRRGESRQSTLSGRKAVTWWPR